MQSLVVDDDDADNSTSVREESSNRRDRGSSQGREVSEQLLAQPLRVYEIIIARP